jgi:hypothetical protein
MTQVYVDKYGDLWLFSFTVLFYQYAFIYENGGVGRAFVDSDDSEQFREAMGMELLGKL